MRRHGANGAYGALAREGGAEPVRQLPALLVASPGDHLRFELAEPVDEGELGGAVAELPERHDRFLRRDRGLIGVDECPRGAP